MTFEDIHAAHRLSLLQIAASASVIPREFLNSPQFNCEPLSAALGCHLTIKLDFCNPIRSFKGRGASFFVSEYLRCGDARAMVCASAGNWGQAMAYACRRMGLPIVIFASEHASALKVQRMRDFGADVRIAGHDFDAAKDAAKAHAARIGGWMVEDGQEPQISEGHGTLAMELLGMTALGVDARGTQPPLHDLRGATSSARSHTEPAPLLAAHAYDTLLVPLGNGALLCGMARWFKAVAPSTKVIGICAATAPSMANSWREQRVRPTPTANTIADGIAVREPIAQAVQDMHGIVDDVLLVSEANIVQAMRLCQQHAGLVLEPAGAVGLAALVAHEAQFAGQRVATVLCGSNITAAQFAEYTL